MTAQSIQPKVRKMLADEFGLEEDIAFNAPLFSSGLLDSLNSLQILTMVESEFDLKISPIDVALDDFDSIDSIAQTVERLKT